jgi:lipoprotein signal peptidase
MRCLWTAHAEAILGVILAVVAAGMWFLREKETRTILCILAIIIGFAILMMVTRFLFGIGVCVNPDMPCVVYMRPAVYTVAPIIIVIGAVGLVINLVTFKPGKLRE